MSEPIEQRVEGYEDLMDALMARIKVDIEDYVRDIAVASWNAAITDALNQAAMTMVNGRSPGQARSSIMGHIERRRI